MFTFRLQWPKLKVSFTRYDRRKNESRGRDTRAQLIIDDRKASESLIETHGVSFLLGSASDAGPRPINIPSIFQLIRINRWADTRGEASVRTCVRVRGEEEERRKRKKAAAIVALARGASRRPPTPS